MCISSVVKSKGGVCVCVCAHVNDASLSGVITSLKSPNIPLSSILRRQVVSAETGKQETKNLLLLSLPESV
jgi:hypothetical protein